jgi:putative endonuclease
MRDLKHQRGRDGESISVAFLQLKGVKILARNWRPKSKLRGELDIVAVDGDCICFVEVKTRSSVDFGEPQEAVNFAKQKQIVKLAAAFLSEKKWDEVSYRFDIVEVWLLEGQKPRVNWIRDAFEARD